MLSFFRSRQDTGREETFILTFHTAFLVTGADPSHSLQMTINRFPHYDTLPSVVILSGDKNAL